MTTILRNDLNTHNIYKPLKPNTTTNRFQRTDQESCFHREKRDPPPENPTVPYQKRVTFSEREERPTTRKPHRSPTRKESHFQWERRETPPDKPHKSFSAREKRDPTTVVFSKKRSHKLPSHPGENPTSRRRRLFVDLWVWFSLPLLKLVDRVSIWTLRTISTVRASILYKLRLDFGVSFE